MKVPVSWLREYFTAALDPQAAAERLTLSGIEVDSFQPIGALDPKVVVAEILEVGEIKPGIARVQLRADRVRSVVSNAPGLQPGRKLALALPGATLFAEDLSGLEEVREAEVFGGVSEGKVVNAAALGLGENHSDPIFLASDAPVGTAFVALRGEAAAVGGDEVLLLAILPNIARCQSMVGVAREVGALLNLSVKAPAEPPPLPSGGKLSPSITATDAARVLELTLLENVRVTESPRWLKRRLVLAGMTPINNVVDASNYVMVQLGQPTHPYDADRLSDLNLGVRRSRKGDVLLTLQQNEAEQPLALPEGVPIITSADAPVAVAGVIGGRPTSIHAQSTRVLLEAASFEYVAIRRSQQATKTYSEASARFSRGVNPELPALASRRFVEVLRETSPDLQVVSTGAAAHNVPRERSIDLTLSELNGSLGTDITLDRAAECLEQVGLTVTIHAETLSLQVTVGNTRLDITESCDLVEEVARIEGFDNIPETMPIEPIPERRHQDQVAAREHLRDLLVGAGLQEIISYSLNGTELEAKLFAGHAEAARPPLVPVLNPVSADRAVLRSSLLPALLQTAALNLRHSAGCRLFELGPVFSPTPEPRDVPNELARVAVVLAGHLAVPSLHDQKPRVVDFFDLKAVLEGTLASLDLPAAVEFVPYTGVPYRPGAAAEIKLGERSLGTLGAVHPRVLEAFDIAGEAVVVADLSLAELLPPGTVRHAFVDYDRLPSIQLDIAAFVGKRTTAGALRGVVRASAGPLLRHVEVFDEFESADFGDKKSVALRLRFNAGSRTLEMAEAVQARDQVARALEQHLNATIRE